jgi:hypothetical protein
MARTVTGRLSWDTINADARQWILSFDGPSDATHTLLPLDGPVLAHDASTYDLAGAIDATLRQVTQPAPSHVTLTRLPEGNGYSVRITYPY